MNSSVPSPTHLHTPLPFTPAHTPTPPCAGLIQPQAGSGLIIQKVTCGLLLPRHPLSPLFSENQNEKPEGVSVLILSFLAVIK